MDTVIIKGLVSVSKYIDQLYCLKQHQFNLYYLEMMAKHQSNRKGTDRVGNVQEARVKGR